MMAENDAQRRTPVTGRSSVGKPPNRHTGWYAPDGEANAVVAGVKELARVKADDVLGKHFNFALEAVVSAAAKMPAEAADPADDDIDDYIDDAHADLTELARDVYGRMVAKADAEVSGGSAEADGAAKADQ